MRHGLHAIDHVKGAAAAEFAVVAVVYLALIIAVFEFARLMYIYATAVEATRLGARIAAVCNVNDVDVKAHMKKMLGILEPGNIEITYPGTTCSAANCPPVTVRLRNVQVTLSIPLAPLTFPLPDFATSVPAESLNSTNNPICDPPT